MFRITALFLLVLGVLTAPLAPLACAGGYKHGRGKTHAEKQAAINTSAIYTGATGRAVPVRPLSALPSHFDWCDVDGKSYCTSSWNQHIPRYCGSCYIHGALAAANDRIKVQLDGRHDVMLARQVILNCGPSKGLGAGCDGGERWRTRSSAAHRKYGLPDESCANYVAEAAPLCDQQAICANCMPIGEAIFPYRCWAVPSPILYYVHEYGQVHGEAAMMSEIYARGPITCGFASVDDFDYAYRGGIYVDSTNASELNHDVEIVGWGEEHGVKYWKARNSWGTYWGENGFFRIQRGSNNMQIESDCVFALFDTHHLEDVLEGKMGGSMFGIVQHTDSILNLTAHNHTHIAHSNDNTEAEKEGRRALELDREEEAEEKSEAGKRAHGFSHSHGHNHGHRPRRGSAGEETERESSSHFGGEPTLRRTNEAMHAADAAEMLDSYSVAYVQQQRSYGVDEVDGNTLDRESRQDTHNEQHVRPHADKHGSRGSSHAGVSRGTSAQPSYPGHRSYAVEQSEDDAERQAEANIMSAIRAAYQREQTRKHTPPHSGNREVDREEREGRTQDQSDIAAAIHAALNSVGDRDAVKAIVLRCLQRLEEEEAAEVKDAEVTGADASAVKEERERDVRIVEEETGRMWRQQSANQTTDDVTDSIERFIEGLKKRGEKVVHSLANQPDSDDTQLEDDSEQWAVEVDGRGEDAAGMGGQHVLFGVMVGVVLGAVVCMASVYYVWMKHKQRHDYLEL